MPNEVASERFHSNARLGGHKQPLRALKNVQPYMKKKFPPGMASVMNNRFSSLERKANKKRRSIKSVIPVRR